nr:MAG TPA: hypothetical protein [Caudoviricetes sp.]
MLYLIHKLERGMIQMFTAEDKQQKWYKMTYKDALVTWFQLIITFIVIVFFVFEYVDTADEVGEVVDHSGQVVTVSRDF